MMMMTDSVVMLVCWKCWYSWSLASLPFSNYDEMMMMTDSGDVGGENVDILNLCLRSLIDPGRWRAPARSSWSPFFINNSETTKAPKIHPSLQKSWLFKDDSGDITLDRVHSPVFNRLSDLTSKGGSWWEIGRSRLFSKRRPETHWTRGRSSALLISKTTHPKHRQPAVLVCT